MKNPKALHDYAQRGYRSVQGWLDPMAVDLVLAIAARQEALGIGGGIVEIGIHHGRLFILLHLLAGEGERSAAYDLFEMQADNVDHSGSGDKDIFIGNLRRHGGDFERTVVRSKNSLDMTRADVVADAGRVRLFSVDGGHTADITSHDLALAEASLCDGGVLILDDYFNPGWPGVAEGAARYLAGGQSRLVPVCIGGNKFIFTNDEARAAAYREAVRAMPGRPLLLEQVAFGHPVVVAQEAPLTVRLARTAAWRHLKATKVGPKLKAVALNVLRHR